MKISNPLTIIAIFSGLAEVLATVTLIKLPLELQEKFIYFVMAFPALLVMLFFLVLVFKNESLYAPSDYHNEENYLKAQKVEKAVKLKVINTVKDIVNEVHTSDEEKMYLTNEIGNTVEESFKSARREQILEALRIRNEANTTELSEDTGIHPTYASLILNTLADEGEIKKVKQGRYVIWQANA